MNKIAFWIWTACCVVAAGLLIRFVPASRNYAGTEVTFTIGFKEYVVVNTPVTVEAAASNFFKLKTLSGETIVGMLAEKPLGLGNGSYYKAGPVKIQGGQWIIEDGSDITMRMTSEEPLAVQVAMKSDAKKSLIFYLAIVDFLVWMLMILFVRNLKNE